MKSEFLLAITQLSAEKSLPKEVVITAIESALVSAYRKDSFAPNQNIIVKINPNSGKVEVWAEKITVDKVTDSRQEISLAEAKRLKKDIVLGEAIVVEATPQNAGRIAAQTAKQVILQRLHEAEHSAIFEEYANKEGDTVTGVVQRIEAGNIIMELGRAEAVMPPSEQVKVERYRVGQRLKVLVVQVARTTKGAKVVVSRSHPNLVRRLFELEVPEVLTGAVEIKSIAREAGFRSKVAVYSKQEGIDPVGCCVGLRGIRIQNVVTELTGEKIDVVLWNANVGQFVANALSPAHIVAVELNERDQIATVVVPDKQLSLAIGKEGQNARLAAKLTGWRIDIKSSATAEAERLAASQAAAAAAEIAAAAEAVRQKEYAAAHPAEVAPPPPPPAAAPVAKPEPVVAHAPVVEVAPPAVEEPLIEEEEPVAEPEPEENLAPVFTFTPREEPGKPQIRFAEDILGPRGVRGESKSRKKKKKAFGKEKDEGLKAKSARRVVGDVVVKDDEEF